MVQTTRKFMTMHKALHPKHDVGKVCVSRKERERGLASFDDSIDALIQRLGNDIEKRGERLITATINISDDTRITRTKITRKQKWKENNSMDVLSD